MSDWTMWASLVGQLITAIAQAMGKPVEEVRQRLLADPRLDGAASDAAASLIEAAMPRGGAEADTGAGPGSDTENDPGKEPPRP